MNGDYRNRRKLILVIILFLVAEYLLLYREIELYEIAQNT